MFQGLGTLFFKKNRKPETIQEQRNQVLQAENANKKENMKKKFLLPALFMFMLSCGDKGSNTPAPPPPEPPETEMLPMNSLIFKSGVWAEHRVDSVVRFEKMRGVKLDIISVFTSRESWKDMQNTWFMSPAQIPPGFKGTINVGMPLWPEDCNLEEAAAGNYNAEWEKLGNSIAAKFPDAYLRPGMEMNILNMYWMATPANKEKWMQAFRHAIASLRKASDKFRIMWVVNIGLGQTGTQDATEFYPGNEWVDFIGFDVYDWWPPYTTVETIKRIKEGPYSWDFWLNFSKSKGKKLVIPEWGIASLHPQGGRDNPKFINFVYSWLRDNKDWIEMECYFQNTKDIGSDLFTSRNPLSSAEYKAWMSKLKK